MGRKNRTNRNTKPAGGASASTSGGGGASGGGQNAAAPPKAGPTKPVRFRSRHARYRFRDLQFENFSASTSDAGVIAAAQADPNFGQRREFWIEDRKAEPAPETETTGEPKTDPGSTPPAE